MFMRMSVSVRGFIFCKHWRIETVMFETNLYM